MRQVVDVKPSWDEVEVGGCYTIHTASSGEVYSEGIIKIIAKHPPETYPKGFAKKSAAERMAHMDTHGELSYVWFLRRKDLSIAQVLKSNPSTGKESHRDDTREFLPFPEGVRLPVNELWLSQIYFELAPGKGEAQGRHVNAAKLNRRIKVVWLPPDVPVPQPPEKDVFYYKKSFDYQFNRYVYVGPTEVGCVHGPLRDTPPDQLPPDPLGDQPPPCAADAELARPAKRARKAAAGTRVAAAAAKPAPRARAARAPPAPAAGQGADAIVVEDEDGNDSESEEADPRPVRPRLPDTLRYPEPRLPRPGSAAAETGGKEEAVEGPGECRVVPYYTALGFKNCEQEGHNVGCRADHPSLRHRPPGHRKLLHLCCGPGGFCMHMSGDAPGGPARAGEGAAGSRDSDAGASGAQATGSSPGKGGRTAGAGAREAATAGAAGAAAGSSCAADGAAVGGAAGPGGADGSRALRLHGRQWLLSQLVVLVGLQSALELVEAWAVDKDPHATFTFKANQRGAVVYRSWVDEVLELVRRWIALSEYLRDLARHEAELQEWEQRQRAKSPPAEGQERAQQQGLDATSGGGELHGGAAAEGGRQPDAGAAGGSSAAAREPRCASGPPSDPEQSVGETLGSGAPDSTGGASELEGGQPLQQPLQQQCGGGSTAAAQRGQPAGGAGRPSSGCGGYIHDILGAVLKHRSRYDKGTHQLLDELTPDNTWLALWVTCAPGQEDSEGWQDLKARWGDKPDAATAEKEAQGGGSSEEAEESQEAKEAEEVEEAEGADREDDVVLEDGSSEAAGPEAAPLEKPLLVPVQALLRGRHALPQHLQLLRLFVDRIREEDLIPMPGNVFVVLAGTPCQHMSDRNLTAPGEDIMDSVKNRLVMPVLELVRLLRPSYVYLEQVMGAVKREDAMWVRTTEGILEMMGYNHLLQDVAAGAYGAAESRQRLFMVASDMHSLLPPAPWPTHKYKHTLKLLHVRDCRPQAPEGELLLPGHTSADAVLGLGPVDGYTTSTLGRRGPQAPGHDGAAAAGAAGPSAADEAEDDGEDGAAAANPLLAHVLSRAEPPPGTTSREVRLAIAFAFSVPHISLLWRTLSHLRALLEQEEARLCKRRKQAAGLRAVEERVMAMKLKYIQESHMRHMRNVARQLLGKLDAARSEFQQVDDAFRALLEHEKAEATGDLAPQVPPARLRPASPDEAPSAAGSAGGTAVAAPPADAAAAAGAAPRGADPTARVRELLARLGVQVANHHSQLLSVPEMQRIQCIPPARGAANTYLFDDLFPGGGEAAADTGPAKPREDLLPCGFPVFPNRTIKTKKQARQLYGRVGKKNVISVIETKSRPTGDVNVHPTATRVFTVRELLRMHTFPDYYTLVVASKSVAGPIDDPGYAVWGLLSYEEILSYALEGLRVARALFQLLPSGNAQRGAGGARGGGAAAGRTPAGGAAGVGSARAISPHGGSERSPWLDDWKPRAGLKQAEVELRKAMTAVATDRGHEYRLTGESVAPLAAWGQAAALCHALSGQPWEEGGVPGQARVRMPMWEAAVAAVGRPELVAAAADGAGASGSSSVEVVDLVSSTDIEEEQDREEEGQGEEEDDDGEDEDDNDENEDGSSGDEVGSGDGGTDGAAQDEEGEGETEGDDEQEEGDEGEEDEEEAED
ncbi:hypothetical protein HXX76_006332 [Chlamydomonas incerta]|uniref:DNA (cytosine-5-)-methyltransferase n=1 Tax=Chlamydomonas incerta TaxID=51695 RepID=A0A835T0Y0_CHLIN|nr:hypothetical protein HXX76_006332 [Chlamydomonas incerta]|eukprot:KAG2436809.1 hypothetical protein HXX76_006332 [Chlamydomonas incerta]